MNENERWLLRHVCNGDLKRAQDQAKTILEGIKTQKDEQFRDNMLANLNAQKTKLFDLPHNLRGMIVAENVEDFPIQRFLIRPEEERVASEILRLYRAADNLKKLNIPYLPALILHGQSGCGKTMLAKYIAYKANLPFVYVKFSNLVGQYLGNTQSNIGRIFEYIQGMPCVLCFDELDAIGMARGQRNDVGEMNRIVIALMQEMDQCSNNMILIGTTNRYDRLDPALVRRFSLHHEVMPLTEEESKSMARAFFTSCNTTLDKEEFDQWFASNLKNNQNTSSDVVRECTKYVVDQIIKAESNKEEDANE